MARTIHEIIDMTMRAMDWSFDHGGLHIAMAAFILTCWMTFGPSNEERREFWRLVGGFFGVRTWKRTFRIMRGMALRYMLRWKRRFQSAVGYMSYLSARVYLDMFYREQRHIVKTELQRQNSRKKLERRIRHRIERENVWFEV